MQAQRGGNEAGLLSRKNGMGHGNAFLMPVRPPGMTVFLICPSASLLSQSYEHSRCSVNACKPTLAKMPQALVTSVSSLRP